MELHLHCGIADLLPRQMLSCLNSEQVKFVKSWTDRLTDSQPGGPDCWLGYSVLSTGHLYSSSFARLTGDQPPVKISLQTEEIFFRKYFKIFFTMSPNTLYILNIHINWQMIIRLFVVRTVLMCNAHTRVSIILVDRIRMIILLLILDNTALCLIIFVPVLPPCDWPVVVTSLPSCPAIILTTTSTRPPHSGSLPSNTSPHLTTPLT